MMERREFFRRGVRESARALAHVAAEKLPTRIARYVRPPFADPEFERLCTRCDACAKACSYDVLFSLSKDQAGAGSGLPAMDLLNKGCRLCDGWPCVTACEAGALRLPGDAEAVPHLAHVSIDEELCLPYSGPECGACAHACPVDGALNWVDQTKPAIDPAACVGCALCRATCIANPNAINVSVLPVQRTEPPEAA